MQSWFELHLQFTICGFSWINYWVAWSLIPHSSTLRQHFAGWSWHWHLKMLTRHSIDCFSHRHHPGGRRNCTFPLLKKRHGQYLESSTKITPMCFCWQMISESLFQTSNTYLFFYSFGCGHTLQFQHGSSSKVLINELLYIASTSPQSRDFQSQLYFQMFLR